MKQNDFEEKKLSEATPEHMATVVGTLATEDDPCMKARFSKKSYKDAVNYLKEWKNAVVREAIREAREEAVRGIQPTIYELLCEIGVDVEEALKQTEILTDTKIREP